MEAIKKFPPILHAISTADQWLCFANVLETSSSILVWSDSYAEL